MSRSETLNEIMSAFLDYLDALARLIEAIADLEIETKTPATDFGRVFANEENIRFLSEKLGPEAVGKLVIVLLRASSLSSRDLIKVPPEEKKARAAELRAIVKDLKSIMELIDRQLKKNK